MTGLTTKIGAGVLLLALGGLGGYAFSAQSEPVSSTSTSQNLSAPLVRTEVIRRTVRVHRKPKKPKKAPGQAAPSAAPPATSQVASVPPSQSAPAPVQRKPIKTKSSGGKGGGGEREDGGDDDGGEREGGDDD